METFNLGAYFKKMKTLKGLPLSGQRDGLKYTRSEATALFMFPGEEAVNIVGSKSQAGSSLKKVTRLDSFKKSTLFHYFSIIVPCQRHTGHLTTRTGERLLQLD